MTWPFLIFLSFHQPFCWCCIYFILFYFHRHHRRHPVEGVAVRGSSWDPMGGGASCAVQIKRDTTEISGSLSFFFFFFFCFLPRPPKMVSPTRRKWATKWHKLKATNGKSFPPPRPTRKNEVVHTKKMEIGISSIGRRRRHIIDEFVYSNHLNFHLQRQQQQKLN